MWSKLASNRLSLGWRQWVAVILLFALLTRSFNLGYPTGYYFDEVYHAMTAKLIARADARAFEWTHADTIEPHTYVEWLHPPLAKYTQALSIKLLGENAVGWRMSSVVFGVGVVALTALVARRLFAAPGVAVLAAGFAAWDGLLLAQSRIAMNDIHVVFGYLVSLYSYVWYRQRPVYWRLLLVGVAIGLTVSTKWSGVYAWLAIGLFEAGAVLGALSQRWRGQDLAIWRTVLDLLKQSLIRASALIVLPLLIYVGSYALMFAQGKDFAYFVELHRQIFWYQFNLDATHAYQSRPLEWIFDLRPVWYFVEYFDNGTRADIYNLGNPFIFLGGLTAAVASLAFVVSGLLAQFRRKRGSPPTTATRRHSLFNLALSPIEAPPTPLFALGLLVASYVLSWFPWVFSPRIMFFYHYAPAVPLLCLMLAYWLVTIWQASARLQPQQARWLKLALGIFVGLTGLFFVIWYPQWTGIALATRFKTAVYFVLPSWQ